MRSIQNNSAAQLQVGKEISEREQAGKREICPAAPPFAVFMVPTYSHFVIQIGILKNSFFLPNTTFSLKLSMFCPLSICMYHSGGGSEWPSKESELQTAACLTVKTMILVVNCTRYQHLLISSNLKVCQLNQLPTRNHTGCPCLSPKWNLLVGQQGYQDSQIYHSPAV